MKVSIISKKLLLALALLLVTSAFAAEKASFQLSDAATIGGHKLAPGEYQLKWEGSGPNIEVSILSKGKVVATVPARLVEQDNPDRRNTYRTHINDDGTASVTKIDFAGKKYGLSFIDGSASADSTGQKDTKSPTIK